MTEKVRKFAKILAVSLGVSAFAFVLAIIFHAPLLRWSAQLWIVDHSSVEKVDAVIIPGGGLDTRPFGAAEWYHAGKSSRLVIFDVGVSPTEELGIYQPQLELTQELLKKLEVPREAVEVIGNELTSTQSEVIATRKWAEKVGVSSIAVMTEIFPSRRVEWAYRNGFEGSKVAIHVVALPPLHYTAENWWKDEQGLLDFQNEVVKYCYYLVEVTKTVPLEKLVWLYRKEPDNEKKKIQNRRENPYPAGSGEDRQDDPGRVPGAWSERANLPSLET